MSKSNSHQRLLIVALAIVTFGQTKQTIGAEKAKLDPKAAKRIVTSTPGILPSIELKGRIKQAKSEKILLQVENRFVILTVDRRQRKRTRQLRLDDGAILTVAISQLHSDSVMLEVMYAAVGATSINTQEVEVF